MSNDAQGNPIVEGDRYLEAAKAKADDGGKVTLGDGARVADPSDLYPTSALGGGGGGGVTDHGALTGLSGDDHTQYHNDARGDARYYQQSQVDTALAGKANTSHTHTLSDVTDAGTAAAADTGDFAAAAHSHVAADVTDLGDAATKNVGTADGTVAAGDHNHTGVYAPASHTHTVSEITDAGDAAGKNTGTTAGTVAAGDHTHTLADVTDSGNSAGLDVGTAPGTVAAGDHGHTLSDISDAGTAAAQDSSAFAAASHTHVAADVTDLGDSATKDVGTGSGDVASGDHGHVAADVAFAATDRLLGRSTTGAGSGEEIPCTAAGRALLDDADAAAQRTTLGLGSAAEEDASAFAAASHSHTLSDVTDSGALAALDTVGTAQIDDDAVSYAKIQDVSATDRILGRSTAGAGVIEEIACTAAGRALLAAVSAAAQRTALDIAAEFLALDVSNGPLTGDLLVDGGTLAAHQAVVGGEQTLDLYNSASSGASGVRFQIRTRSGSTGDAWFRFENASRYFSIGLDTSEDEFRIGTGAVLGSGNLFRLTSAGLAFLTAALDMGSSKITSLADGSASDDAATVGQLAALVLNDLANVSASSPSSGDLLQWNGSAWVPYTQPILPTYLVAANNLNDLTSASSARSNLGLGSAAQQSVAYFLIAGNDLSDLSDAPTARTNLGLGSAATEAASTFLQASNNLSDLNSAILARSNLGLGSAAVLSESTWLQVSNNLSDLNSLSQAIANLSRPVWSDNFLYLESGLWSNGTSGAGGVFQMPAGNDSNLDDDVGLGWIRIQCGSGSTSGDNAYLVLNQQDKFGSIFGANEVRWRFRLQYNRSTSIKCAWGLANANPSSVLPSPSAMFVVDSANTNIRCQHDDGSASTSDQDSGVSIASLEDTSAWYEIRTTSSSIRFYINGTLVATQSTNLPGGSDDRLSPAFWLEGNGANFASIFLDYVDLVMPEAWHANAL